MVVVALNVYIIIMLGWLVGFNIGGVTICIWELYFAAAWSTECG